ncbi:hypothetical protein [Sporosarcina sp. A2]|uniref:hypothetical protein n=1 Tax=Sporosarcina sp. A2 TaxID=3393449 RepID=UPI003D78EF4C
MTWLLSGVLVSSALLYSSIHTDKWIGRRAMVNTLLVVISLLVGYGTFLAMNLDRPYSAILTIIGYLLIVCVLVSIYWTSLRSESPTTYNVLHGLTITIGLVLTVGTVYCLYIFYLFSEDGNGAIWKLFIPLVVYGVVYVIQMKALGSGHRRTAYSVTGIQILMPFVLVLLWMLVTTGEGGF